MMTVIDIFKVVLTRST